MPSEEGEHQVPVFQLGVLMSCLAAIGVEYKLCADVGFGLAVGLYLLPPTPLLDLNPDDVHHLSLHPSNHL
jgi:hypothetical protein